VNASSVFASGNGAKGAFSSEGTSRKIAKAIAKSRMYVREMLAAA